MSLMAEAGGTAHAEGGAPVIVRVRADQPWRWLEAGWADMRAVPAISLAYGSTFLFVSILLAGLLFLGGASALLPVFGAGFLLVGPMLAVGLYEVSRRLEAGERVRLKDVIFVSSRNLTQLALVGGMLAGAFIIWLQIAGWIFAIFYGAVGIPPLSEFAPLLLLSPRGLALLAIGTAAGGVLAFTAVITSVNAVRKNFWPMLLWGWIIALLTAFGIATWFLGLAVIFPLLGHATWHAHRAVVAEG
jgi:uncharacterized membrane protein